jgi:hypothetical protein
MCHVGHERKQEGKLIVQMTKVPDQFSIECHSSIIVTPEGQQSEMCSGQIAVTYGALLRQLETEHFAAAVLKAQNPRICVHYSGTGN